MRVVADTGPLLAAANRRDRAHELAAALVAALGRDLVVPTTVLVEADHLLRSRVDARAAEQFLAAMAAGEHAVAYLTPQLLRRAVAFDQQYRALGLGLVDASVMAVAEREGLPVLTFDFEDFLAAPSPQGPWGLVIDEARYRAATDDR